MKFLVGALVALLAGCGGYTPNPVTGVEIRKAQELCAPNGGVTYLGIIHWYGVTDHDIRAVCANAVTIEVRIKS